MGRMILGVDGGGRFLAQVRVIMRGRMVGRMVVVVVVMGLG